MTAAKNDFRLLYAAASLQVQHDLLGVSQNILEAWPALRTGSAPLLKWLRANPDPSRRAMLDSGVFSTWSRGEVVNRDDYIKFCKDVLAENLFSVCVGVDVIPGQWGQIPTQEQVEASASAGWDNFMYLLDHGMPPERTIHVFHQGEDFKWLRKLVDFHKTLVAKGQPGLYIGLSPANDRTTKQKIMWLDQCMPLVTNKDGSAILRWHGFGVTSPDIMRRYPWYTCDSTSWMRPGTYGVIMVPIPGKAFLDGMCLIAVTPRSGASQGGNHWNALSEGTKQSIREYLATLGTTIEQVIDDRSPWRQKVNMLFFKQMEKELNAIDTRWKPIQRTFC